jgi:hypothetical protein
MVTAYSPILKLALPVQGELTGTWGDVVNDNITSMVEQAIAGRAVINTWTANAHTLTTVNGLTSESRCAMLQFTDTGTALTGAGTVICPTASKIYIVENASGQNVTVKTSGGTGVLVPNGRTTFLFCDGTNVLVAMTHTTSLELGTSTVVTAVLDEDNMASNSATSLATQQSIKAYVDAQVAANNELSEVLAVGNVTGANDIIVTAGQKITTDTIAETTAAAGVTIDGVLVKDGGATFTADAVFGDNDKAIFGAGSDLQIYHDGTQSIIHDAGTGNLRIKGSDITIQDSDGNGFISMVDSGTGGTVFLKHDGSNVLTTTATGVDVTGTVTADGLVVEGDATIVDSDSNTDLYLGGGTGQTAVNVYGPLQTTNLQILNNNSNAFLTTTGGSGFSFRAKTASGTHLFSTTDTHNSRMQIANNGDISFYEDTGTTPKFFWDASTERLGIGTTTPAATLEVVGTIVGNIASFISDGNSSNSKGIKIQGGTDNGFGENYKIEFFDGDGTASGRLSTNTGALILEGANFTFNENGGDYDFRVESDTNTHALFVQGSDGNVGIGTSSPANPLQVQGNVGFNNAAGTQVAAIFPSLGGSFRLQGQTTEPMTFWTNNTQRVTIDSGGNVGIGTSSPSSDLHVADNDITAYNSAATDGQLGAGSTLFVEQTGGSNTALSQIVFQPRAGYGYNRIINSGGSAPYMAIATNNAERMRVDASGNVGIGTSSPQSGLEVSATAVGAITVPLTVSNQDTSVTGTGVGIGFVVDGVANAFGAQIEAERTASAYHASALKFRTRDTSGGGLLERMRIDSGGNVGIGTGSPAAVLDVVASSGGDKGVRVKNTGLGRAAVEIDAGGTSTAKLGFLNQGTSTGQINSSTTVPFIFSGANSTERMRIDSSGNVGIGTSSPARSLDVNGVIRVADNTPVEWGGVTTRISGSSASNTLFFSTNNTERMRIDSGGNVGIGTSSPVAIGGHSGILTVYGSNATALVLKNNVGQKDIRLNNGDLKITNSVGTAQFVLANDGNVGIGTASPRTILDIEGIVALDGDSGTTSSTTQTSIATYVAATFKGCKTVITANDGTDTYVTELLIANTGAAAVATEYGQVGTGSFTVGYEVDVSGGNVRILATALNATSTTYKVSKTLM